MTPAERLTAIKNAFAPDCAEGYLPSLADVQDARSLNAWLAPDYRICVEQVGGDYKVRLLWRGFGIPSPDGIGTAKTEADAIVLALCDWTAKEIARYDPRRAAA